MAARRGDGLTTPHSQPAKTLTKRTTDFIARCGVTAMNDAGLYLLTFAIATQGVLLVLEVLK